MVIWVKCDYCRGNGSVTTYCQKTCDDCNGLGQVRDFFQPWHHPNDVPRQQGMKTCGGCGGCGRKNGNYEVDCSYCNGKGRTLEPDDDTAILSDPTYHPQRVHVPFYPHSPPQTLELNALGKLLFFTFKTGLVLFVLFLFLSIPAVNQVVYKVPIWFANSGANEKLKKVSVWYASVMFSSAKFIGYPPVKGIWTGHVQCGKKKGEARLILNSPINDRIQARFELRRDGEPRASKKTIDLEGRFENNKLWFEGRGAFDVKGYYAVQATIEFTDYRLTTATGVLRAPGCNAVEFLLNRT